MTSKVAILGASGYTAAELQQITFQDLTHPDDLEADLAKVCALLAGDIETYGMEKRYIRRDGSTVWWRPRPEMNSVANLMLHLAGNVRQWLVSGVGGSGDIRNRPEEFADRSELPKANILSMLQDDQ